MIDVGGPFDSCVKPLDPCCCYAVGLLLLLQVERLAE